MYDLTEPDRRKASVCHKVSKLRDTIWADDVKQSCLDVG